MNTIAIPPESDTPTAHERPLTARMDEKTHHVLSRLSMGLSPISLAVAGMDWWLHLSTSPGRQFELASLALQMHSSPSDAQHLEDARFSDPSWSHWPYSAWRDSFLRTSQWWEEASQVDGVKRQHRQLVTFYARQTLDALSPSNHPWLNPQVQHESIRSLGANLWSGMHRLLADLQPRDWTAPAGTLPPLPYSVGQDVACTPGEVVFRNPLFELIQYHPTTPRVDAEPLLIVPSTIMKYYILDLSPHNSMVRYLVDQGFTVFMVSWRNPDASDRHLGMEDYLNDGVLTALHQVKYLTGQPRVHAMGYCLGGTFLAIVAAWLRRQVDDRAPKPSARRRPALEQDLPELASVTLLAAQTDFSEPGELGLFIDEDQLRTLRESMARTGYFSGRQMANSFKFLHSRDLVWSQHVRHHLLGLEDHGNDMMSWNADTTRLPERMHNEYLTQLFLHNALRNGQFQMRGEPVALRNICAPLMVVGTEKDHVSPWKSVYKVLLEVRGESHFILASGGHNAGIVSEPGHPKRHYRMGSHRNGHVWSAPEEWVGRAKRHEGSWWPAWGDWLHQLSEARSVPARKIPASKALTAAPGNYVMVRYADE